MSSFGFRHELALPKSVRVRRPSLLDVSSIVLKRGTEVFESEE